MVETSFISLFYGGKGVAMAGSKYEYVKQFELDDKLLPNVWIVVRIDGRSFHKYVRNRSFHP